MCVCVCVTLNTAAGSMQRPSYLLYSLHEVTYQLLKEETLTLSSHSLGRPGLVVTQSVWFRDTVHLHKCSLSISFK